MTDVCNKPTIKAILIDAMACTVTETEINDATALKDCYRILECDTIENVPLGGPGNCWLIVDGDGLYKAKALFEIQGYHQALPNKAMITSLSRGGYWKDAALSVEDIQKRIQWVPPHEVAGIVIRLLNSFSIQCFDSSEDLMNEVLQRK